MVFETIKTEERLTLSENRVLTRIFGPKRDEVTGLWKKNCTMRLIITCKVKVKLSLQKAVNAHRVMRRQGSHVFSRQSAHRWR
jgi:hypothetical protein